MSSYITESNNRIKTKFRETFLFGDVFVYATKPLPSDIDLPMILQQIEDKVPEYIGKMIDSILIGDFPQLQRDPPILAFYENGSLFVSSDPPDNKSMFKAILHEMAHAVEEVHGLDIYSDGELENEFLRKRVHLKSKLQDYDIQTDLGIKEFMNCDYSPEFDKFLVDVGYERLEKLMNGMFINPYSATSLSEYFASGFEEFISGDKKYLKNTSPILYDKITLFARQN
jgi:hypothetical protein